MPRDSTNAVRTAQDGRKTLHLATCVVCGKKWETREFAKCCSSACRAKRYRGQIAMIPFEHLEDCFGDGAWEKFQKWNMERT